MTIPELLVKEGRWKQTKVMPKPDKTGLCLTSGGYGRNTRLTFNGHMIPGVYEVDYHQGCSGLGTLVIKARASETNLSDLASIATIRYTSKDHDDIVVNL